MLEIVCDGVKEVSRERERENEKYTKYRGKKLKENDKGIERVCEKEMSVCEREEESEKEEEIVTESR